MQCNLGYKLKRTHGWYMDRYATPGVKRFAKKTQTRLNRQLWRHIPESMIVDYHIIDLSVKPRKKLPWHAVGCTCVICNSL